jgi:Type II secretion system (T2SS), protein E, N-terminal domain
VSVNLHPVTEDVAEPVLPEAAVGGAPVDRIPLGRLFVNAGLLTEAQVDEALREGSQTGERLGEVIVRRGLVTEEKVAQMLAEQWALSYVDRASIWFDADALARLSREDAHRLQAMPTRVQDGRVVVAVAEPTEQRLNALRDVIGSDTVVVVVPKTALDAALNSELLASRGRGDPAPEPAPPLPMPELRLAPEPDPDTFPPPAYRQAVEVSEPTLSSDLDSVAALAQQARTVAESLAAQAAAMRAEAAAHQRQMVEAQEVNELRARVAELEAELAAERAASAEAARHLQAALRALPPS